MSDDALMRRWSRWSLLALLVAAAASGADIPPRPLGDSILWDDAGLLTRQDEAAVAALQREALELSNSPIVVVTISSAADYGDRTVEGLATRWFNAWEIGTLGLERGANQGVLLLVAVQDRRARIELGADWGRDWDDHAKRIMDGTIVPRFKAGDYSAGIVAGVRELHAMVKQGKSSQPPGDFLENRVRPLTKYSLLQPLHFALLMGLGLLTTVLGIYPRFNKWVFFAGVALMMFTAFSWLVIILVGLVFGRRRRHRHGWPSDSWGSSWGGSSGGSSGGGSSGGSSGGGGASGSW